MPDVPCRRLLRHRLPRDDHARRRDVSVAGRMARAVRPAPIRLPRLVARVRGAARRGAGRSSAAQAGDVSSRRPARASVRWSTVGCVDTTMGFTPNEGVPMATRSGSVDVGMLMWLLDAGLGEAELADGCSIDPGLLGLAGTADMREVEAAAADGEDRRRPRSRRVGAAREPGRRGDGGVRRWDRRSGVHRWHRRELGIAARSSARTSVMVRERR